MSVVPIDDRPSLAREVDPAWDPDLVFEWLDAAVPLVVEAERRTDEMRDRVGYGLWVLRQQVKPDHYSRSLAALAATHDVTTRTLHRWRERAEAVLELEPSKKSIAQRNRAAKGAQEEPEGGSLPEPVQQVLFVPEDVAGVRELSGIVAEVGAARWAEALTAAEIDLMLGVLRAAKTRRTTVTTDVVGDEHVHDWKQEKSKALGTIYVCGCGDRQTKRPDTRKATG